MGKERLDDEIEKKTLALKEAILQSDEYRQYIEAKRILEKNEPLYARVNEFRGKNFEFQLKGHLGDIYNADVLCNEYEETLGQAEVMAFMNAELLFCQRLSRMNEELMEEIELELDFL